MSLADKVTFGQLRFIDDGEDALYIEFPDHTVKYVPERTCQYKLAPDGKKRCSGCGRRLVFKLSFMNYCPSCGARVIGGSNGN